MLVLLVINLVTVTRQYQRARRRQDHSGGRAVHRETSAIQIMENRLFLGNYLLSGDLRDEDKTNKGISDLQDLLKRWRGKGE